MFEVRDDIKTIVKSLGYKLTDLSIELKMNYDSLNHYLNGRRQMPPELSERITTILDKWENGL